MWIPWLIRPTAGTDRGRSPRAVRATGRLVLLAWLLGGLLGCGKEDIPDEQTLRQLYRDYQAGEITACTHRGETVYTAALNAVDAGSVVFDAAGNQIGICNFAWGVVDTICGQLTDCEVVYRVAGNIWGKEAVDRYGLGK